MSMFHRLWNTCRRFLGMPAAFGYGEFVAVLASIEQGDKETVHHTIELTKQATSKARGGELHYFVVTLKSSKRVWMDTWMVVHGGGDSLMDQFSYMHRIHYGDLVLLNAWETTKQVYDRIRLTHAAAARLEI